MILTMKAISLAFDLDKAREEAQREEPPAPVEEEEDVKKKGRKSRDRESRVREKPEAAAAALSSAPGFLEFLGYSFCPGNSVFGPWVKYSEYQSMLLKPVWVGTSIAFMLCSVHTRISRKFVLPQNLTWLVKIVLCMMKALLFLAISTCWNPWMIPGGVWM